MCKYRIFPASSYPVVVPTARYDVTHVLQRDERGSWSLVSPVFRWLSAPLFLHYILSSGEVHIGDRCFCHSCGRLSRPPTCLYDLTSSSGIIVSFLPMTFDRFTVSCNLSPTLFLLIIAMLATIIVCFIHVRLHPSPMCILASQPKEVLRLLTGTPPQRLGGKERKEGRREDRKNDERTEIQTEKKGSKRER